MSEVRVLPDADIDSFVEIVIRAYPSFRITSADDKQRFAERLASGRVNDPSTELYGLYRDDVLLGGMRLFNFRLNLLSLMVPAGGVGLVAVDLLHKKEHVAKELISFFLTHYAEQGASLALLYPFRPDFYKQMGFGFGTKMNHYRIRPAQLPRGPSKRQVRRLGSADNGELLACYNRYAAATHGMIERAEVNITALLNNPELTVVGFAEGDRIEGYLAFSFKQVRPDNFLLNDLQVEEWVYEHPRALAELLTFLHSQADQVHNVVWNTQDEYFHHLLHDPRNTSNTIVPHVYHESNTQGVGLMYRVLNTQRLFEMLRDHRFGGRDRAVRLTLRDSFFPANARSTVVVFRDGRPTVADGTDPEVEIELDVADFSSLIVGAVPFRRLVTYGRAEISEPRLIGDIDALFATPEKPICLTRF